MTIREVDSTDNAALLALSRATPMRGIISLRIDRDPDFFQLTRLRGDGKAYVALTNGRVMGCISVAYQNVYIEGRQETIGYVADLKVHPQHRGQGVAQALMHTLYEEAKRREVDLYFCMVADGNEQALSLMRGKGAVPPFTPIGCFLVYSILPTPFLRRSASYVVEESRPEEEDELCSLLNDFNSSYQIAPVLSLQSLRARPSPIIETSCTTRLVARRNGAVQATLYPFDTSYGKSDVVIDMPFALQVAARVLHGASRIVPMFTPPRVGEPLRMLYLRNPAFRSGHQEALALLLQHIRYLAYRHKYSFVTIGLHERDPLRSMVRGLPKFTFKSRGFLLSLRGRQEVVARIVGGIPVEDFALV